MSIPIKTSAVLLTFNEIEGITALYDKIPFDQVDEVFCVDGGSTDGTVEFLKERGIRVIFQDIHGRGQAFRIGIREAAGDHCVFFGPDGNEDPADIPRLLAKLEEGYDMAIASRFMPESRNDEDDKIFKWRAWANRAFTLLARMFWGGKITDTINGFRAITRDAFEVINVDAQGFAIEFQMSIRALKAKLKVTEVPTIEGDRIGGESTAYSLPTGLKILRILISEVFLGKKVLKKS
jgi:glycosyltransferase involved in cell wall biosynthesis